MSNQTLQEWQANAAYWVKYADTLHSILSPVTKALIADAGIRSGQSVLDIAGGAGEPALSIAETVGPTGQVTCTDAFHEMLARANTRASKLGLTNVTFRQCLADCLPFTDDTFDVVTCRLGIMLFTDPPKALSEMLRVLRPGGTITLVVWHKSELNPFCSIPANVISRHVPASPSEPDGPGAFRFAEKGKLAGLLSEAGAEDIEERLLEFDLEAPLSFSQFWEMRSQTSGTLREKLATVTVAKTLDIEREVRDESLGYFQAGKMKFPASMIVVSAKKPLAPD